MSSTATLTPTFKSLLDRADPNELADLLRQMKVGLMFSSIKCVVAGATASATFDLTALQTAAVLGTGTCVVTGISPAITAPGALPAAQTIKTLRVTASATAGSIGPYVITDSGGTPAVQPTATAYAGAALGLATLSDDGKTITFPNTVTAFVIEYEARPSVDMTANAGYVAP